MGVDLNQQSNQSSIDAEPRRLIIIIIQFSLYHIRYNKEMNAIYVRMSVYLCDWEDVWYYDDDNIVCGWDEKY